MITPHLYTHLHTFILPVLAGLTLAVRGGLLKEDRHAFDMTLMHCQRMR